MKITRVKAAFFSATGTTERIVKVIVNTLAEQLGVTWSAVDFTLPASRTVALQFEPHELVVLGTPVYAGRVPNVLLKYLSTIEGNGAPAIPVVLYGNRNYDDGLIELRDILEQGGLHTVAAAAFVGEHSFSDILAAGRPDESDLRLAREFAVELGYKIKAQSVLENPVPVKGIPAPYRGYYQPRDKEGNPVDIRKVKPLTNENCDRCMICAEVCPMGSIDPEDVTECVGICIKCGACIKKCPVKAKYFADPGFLNHKYELEDGLTRRAEPELFL